ncbi:MAG TPA: hypothetical protein ENN03_03280 [bacterium]|nr:hypothetical protein [bacterium]
MKRLTTISMIGLLAFSAGALSQIADRDRFERDLRIMEGILDKLVSENRQNLPFSKARGFYLDNFGVIFQLDHSSDIPRFIVRVPNQDLQVSLEKMKKDREEMEKQIQKQVSAAEEVREKVIVKTRENLRNWFEFEKADTLDDQERAELRKKTLENMEENIRVFFRNYASSISQLNEQDRIAVIVRLKDWHPLMKFNAYLSGGASRADIMRFRRGQISEQQFDSLVEFHLIDETSDLSSDIEIMREVLKRGLESGSYRVANLQNGLYLDGFGVVYSMEIPSLSYVREGSSLFSIVIDKNSYALKSREEKEYQAQTEKKEKERDFMDQIAAREKRSKEEQEKMEQRKKDFLNNLKSDLIELAGSYGHTLRLEPDEWMVITAHINGHTFWPGGRKAGPTHMTLQFKKKDLDAFHTGGLTEEAFQKRVIVRSF